MTSSVTLSLAAWLILGASPEATKPVSTVAQLEMHSTFWPNLHHTLYAAAWAARPPSKEWVMAGPLPQPLTGTMTTEERTAWDAAVKYYSTELAS